LKDASIHVKTFDRPGSAPEQFKYGETYALRLEPSDKTWTDMEQGNSLFVGGDELEVVEKIPE